jgi:hypothetical protein
VRAGSTELAPGHYKAEWSGPADGVKIEIFENGKTVATGQVKHLPRALRPMTRWRRRQRATPERSMRLNSTTAPTLWFWEENKAGAILQAHPHITEKAP